MEAQGRPAPLVVIVEDDLDYAESLAQLLIDRVTPRVAAVRGTDEFWQLDLSDARCVVLDYYLHDRSAGDVQRFIAEVHGKFPHLKVILHSGLAEPIDITTSDASGIFSYIPKDEQPELIATLQSLVTLAQVDAAAVTVPRRLASTEEPPAERTEGLGGRSLERDAQRRVKAAYKDVAEEYGGVVRHIAQLSTSGQTGGALLDTILGELIERADARGGAWFVLDRGLKSVRNSNCKRLGRLANLKGSLFAQPRRLLGSMLYEHLARSEPPSDSSQAADVDPAEADMEPIALGDATHADGGVFAVTGTVFGERTDTHAILPCRLQLTQFDEILLFVLEVPEAKAATAKSAVSVYVAALRSILVLLPLHMTRGEFGRLDVIGRGAERLVSSSQAASRVAMSALSLALFASALVSAVVAALLLVSATIGLPDLMSRSLKFVIAPSPYGVGIVTALEVFILAVTLYLMGVGLSSMMEHPRLSRVPQVLRYLDTPEEMKKSLILAVCTLLSVAGVKAVLEFSERYKYTSVIGFRVSFGFIAQMAAIILLLLALTRLIATMNGRDD